jgi:predicted Zn finger-like uncharacterized protein
MRIVCPHCSTTYEVPDAVFGGRPRKLRCVQCGYQWRSGPPNGAEHHPYPPSAPDAPPAPAPTAPAQQAQELPQPDETAAATGPQPPRYVLGIDPGTPVEGHAGFYDLVIAARNNALELEPEPPPPPKLRASSVAFTVILAALLLLLLVLLMHHGIGTLIPATRHFYGLLGL